MDTNETPESTVTEDQPVVNTDAAKSKTRAFFAKHKTKFVATGITSLGVVSFLAGRASTAVVEDVDVVIETPDSSDGSVES